MTDVNSSTAGGNESGRRSAEPAMDPAPARIDFISRRAEFGAFAVFCLLNLAIPLAIVDLYPFSRAPMFADAPRRFCTYTVLGPDGAELPARDFALHRNYWGNPLGAGCGFHPPESLDRFGTVPDARAVVEHVEGQLARRPELPFVDVIRQVTGPSDALRIGQVEWTRWRIRNPQHREVAAP